MPQARKAIRTCWRLGMLRIGGPCPTRPTQLDAPPGSGAHNAFRTIPIVTIQKGRATGGRDIEDRPDDLAAVGGRQDTPGPGAGGHERQTPATDAVQVRRLRAATDASLRSRSASRRMPPWRANVRSMSVTACRRPLVTSSLTTRQADAMPWREPPVQARPADEVTSDPAGRHVRRQREPRRRRAERCARQRPAPDASRGPQQDVLAQRLLTQPTSQRRVGAGHAPAGRPASRAPADRSSPGAALRRHRCHR